MFGRRQIRVWKDVMKRFPTLRVFLVAFCACLTISAQTDAQSPGSDFLPSHLHHN